METKYLIKDMDTNRYLDWYCADVYFTELDEVSNCKYDTYENAKKELLQNKDYIWVGQKIIIEEIMFF